MPAILWFRRDLRLGDNPALLAASTAAPDGILPLFVLDPALLGPAGRPRKDFLFAALRSLDACLEGRLVIRTGDPAAVVASVAEEVGASSVHIASDHGPYGCARDLIVQTRLCVSDRPLVRTGSPYAVCPGSVLRQNGAPYKVFTPFSRAWVEHGWRQPAESSLASAKWLTAPSEAIPSGSGFVSPTLPAPTEYASLARLELVLARSNYGSTRDLPAIDGTSLLSAALRWGLIHPRTVLARLGPDDDALRDELCWREFYADVVHHQPHSVRESMSLSGLVWNPPGEHFEAWALGRTGYPIIDAGMRQLLEQGWMHNRVRMLAASFLVKDLHIDWRLGARHFMRHLVDGDLASNSHGWQWSAGTGTDAAPFFRIFNPVLQGKRFDPDGSYVRRFVPEVAHVSTRWVHEPWRDPAGPPPGYPSPIVDHSMERVTALARLKDA